jgi:hypothetical protein
MKVLEFGTYVDHQNTLNCPAMDIAQNANIKIAKRNSWEMTTLGPLSAIPNVRKNSVAPERILRSQEGIKNNELQHNVQNIKQFSEEIHHGKIKSVSLAPYRQEIGC